MRKAALVFVLLGAIFVLPVHAQVGATETTAWATYLKLMDSAQTALKQLSALNTLVSKAAATAEYQAKTVQSLSSGNWEGVLSAYKNQIMALNAASSGLSVIKENTTDSTQATAIGTVTEALDQTSKNLSDQLAVLSAIDDTVKNSQTRAKAAQSLLSQSADSDSFITQMQIAQQLAALNQAEISDLKTVIYTNQVMAQNQVAYETKMRLAQAKQAQENQSESGAESFYNYNTRSSVITNGDGFSSLEVH